MYRLTERRLSTAQHILDRYAEQLETKHSIASMRLEKELRDVWGLGYQTLKDVMIDMLSHERYALVAAYYMQYQNGPGPVSEFKPHLANLYGLRTYDCPERQARQDAFWEAAFQPVETN